MSTARTATPVVAPRRRTGALQLLPAAALFAGLVLGGPSFAEEPSSELGLMRDWCKINDKGHEICTGENSGDGSNIYDPAGGSYVIVADI